MKWRRIVNTLGAIMLAAGLLVCWMIWQWSGQNPFAPVTPPGYREVQLTPGDMETPSLTIEEGNSAVYLALSPDNGICVNGCETGRERLETTQDAEGNVLIRRIDERRWYERISFFFDWPDSGMTVRLPENYAGTVTVHTGNGDIVSEEAIRIGGALMLQTGNGRVCLENVTAGGAVEVHSGNGRLVFSDVNARFLTAESANGDIQARDIAAEERISLKTLNGDIEPERVESAEIRLHSHNGDVKGSIAGNEREYEISAETSNGDMRLPDGRKGAQNKLYVSTGNGDIELEFVE